MREFEQMEMQFFVKPVTELEWFPKWKEIRLKWHKALGFGEMCIRDRSITNNLGFTPTYTPIMRYADVYKRQTIKFLNGLEMPNWVFGHIGDRNVWKGPATGWRVLSIWKVRTSISTMWNIMAIPCLLYTSVIWRR